jgi:hypothetical protein
VAEYEGPGRPAWHQRVVGQAVGPGREATPSDPYRQVREVAVEPGGGVGDKGVVKDSTRGGAAGAV